MNRFKKLLPKISALLVTVASFSLCFIANSTSSTWCFQPEEPNGIEQFKL